MKVGRNDPCPCGSGKKYKKCCLNKQEQLSIGSSDLSLDDRTRVLYNAMLDIFQFNKAKDWNDIKKSITKERTKEFYKVIAWLWPPDTDIGSILPRQDQKLRALYIGRYRPELILRNIVRYTLYTDEILVVLPFVNPWNVRKEFDPIINPGKFREDTLKSIAMVHQLGPWVFGGFVKIIPDPGDFDHKLRIKTWDMAKERVRDRKLTEKDFAEDMEFAKQDLQRMLYRMPPEPLKALIRKAVPDIEEKKINKMVTYMEKRRKEDPLTIDELAKSGESEFEMFRTGANLEMGLYIAQLSGAYLYTDIKPRWEEILSVTRKLPEEKELWGPLTKAFQSLSFKFLDNISPNFACALRKEGRLEGLRSFLRKIWIQIGGGADPSRINSMARDFSDELKTECAKAESEWKEIDKKLFKWVGGSGAVATISSASMRWEMPAVGFCIAAITQLLGAKYDRTRFRQTVPLSIFIDLKRRTKLQ